ncbi:hypothetical protein PITCH_A1280062 [uncultured Desulfobacterium sp.]|uniref:Phage ABA sandwich domain-containing protein n=1 Tax=uncultured Desulfobacterium sp. TaxID=201089 RepID=A0A445MS85_9BACT|nr:hypothetical protein PITCH_A1280062 [uncultured Desulfobacterium sp.]
MSIDDIMNLSEEDLTLIVAEIQGHKNLQWMPNPFEDNGRMLIDRDTNKPILSPVDNILAAWNLWREMNQGEPFQWAIFGRSDGEIIIEYFGTGDKRELKQGSGLWAITGPDAITITRAYIIARTGEG